LRTAISEAANARNVEENLLPQINPGGSDNPSSVPDSGKNGPFFGSGEPPIVPKWQEIALPQRAATLGEKLPDRSVPGNWDALLTTRFPLI